MHRQITAAQKGFDVDHINHDGLDNQRANLRVCTRHENMGNRRKVRGQFKHKGVSRHGRRFKAEIYCNGKKHYLGLFSTPEEAGKAYSEGAKRFYGVFACTQAA